ncbi:MAG: chorismate mutase [Flavobacteriales bacterium]|jgi:chorismate mutase
MSWINKDKPYIIAGPCSAESELQLLQTAKQLQAIGKVSAIRAGVWKPRTRPGSFEGIGVPALDWLSTVKKETGLSVMTEVGNPHHVEAALKAGIDQLWIGARTTVNPFYVQEIAEALKGVDIPVMVKNPIHPEIGLWIGAIERFQTVGISNIAAIHRGFYTYESAPFRNEPKWEIAIELRHLAPNIPIICDPSHIAGKPELIKEVSQTAFDLNFDGLMVESHFQPERALSDKEQQVTPKFLAQLLDELVIRSDSSDNTEFQEHLRLLRTKIDQIDMDLLQVLAKRMNITAEIGKFKQANNVTIFQLNRWFEILESRKDWGTSKGLSENFVYELYQLIHKNSIRVQTDVMKP